MANVESVNPSQNEWWLRNEDLVEEALSEYRTSLASIEKLGLKQLSPGLKILIWALRGYVLFMVVVVIINVIQTLH